MINELLPEQRRILEQYLKNRPDTGAELDALGEPVRFDIFAYPPRHRTLNPIERWADDLPTIIIKELFVKFVKPC